MRVAYPAPTIARWRVEHLRKRAERDQCDGQSLLCVETRGACADAALHAGSPRGGAAPGRYSADEYLLEALSRAAWAVSVGPSPYGAAGDDPISAVVLF